MAMQVTSALFLVLISGANADGDRDGCFERFGTNRTLCLESAEGVCEWIEREGRGMCAMPAKRDSCFERFGTDQANCAATNGTCRWVERNGEGKCVMAVNALEDEDGGYEVEISEPSQKVLGVLAISISSSLPPVEVIQTLSQHHPLLERAVARSNGYRRVSILSVEPARRLREVVTSELRVRFEAEQNRDAASGAYASQPQGELQATLQESFEEAGLELQVQSAEVTITAPEVSPSSQDDEAKGLNKLFLGSAALGLVMICGGSATLFVCLRCRKSRDKVPAVGAAVKEKQQTESNADVFASV